MSPLPLLIFDRDAQYGTEVLAAIRSMEIKCGSHFVREFLAERGCRGMGAELPPGLTGSWDRR